MSGPAADRRLAGRVAIVTGASRGIGRCIALTLAGAGASVALASRTLSDLEAVAAEIEAAGGICASFPTDIRVEADVTGLVERTIARFGRLDIVVNNAGMGVFKPLAETTQEEWDRIMEVNARGPFLLCRAAVPYLRRQPRQPGTDGEGHHRGAPPGDAVHGQGALGGQPRQPGTDGEGHRRGAPPGDAVDDQTALGGQPRSTIVNIASVVAVKGYANQAAYSASKHALYGMSKALAREVQSDGIRVHVISPGGVDTDLSARARPDLGRAGLMRPQEIADIVLFLVTRDGNAVIDEINVRRERAMPWA
jgi:NAD(P)-dependent dehydrogenase (short-subunit alcohol dehydrogenase family)